MRVRSRRPAVRSRARRSATGASSGPSRSSRRARPGGRPRPSGTKRGGLSSAPGLMPESTDQDLEGGRLVTEPDGDVRRRPSLDEDGAEGLIAAMGGGSGLGGRSPCRAGRPWCRLASINCFLSSRSPERTGSAGRGKEGDRAARPGISGVASHPAGRAGRSPGRFWGWGGRAAPAGKQITILGQERGFSPEFQGRAVERVNYLGVTTGCPYPASRNLP